MMRRNPKLKIQPRPAREVNQEIERKKSKITSECPHVTVNSEKNINEHFLLHIALIMASY